MLAERGCGGRLLPGFPRWPVAGTKPSRLAWLLEEKNLPPLCGRGMLGRREWLTRPERVDRAWQRIRPRPDGQVT